MGGLGRSDFAQALLGAEKGAAGETCESIGEAQNRRKAEDLMVIADMIHSCSNAHVANAAVSCIGGVFAERVAVAAHRRGMEVGGFVAVIVQDFARRADDDALRALNREIAGADQPILQGLAHLVEPALAPEPQVDSQAKAVVQPRSALADRRSCGSAAYAH
jgi:hypothetical protein